jgi:hypothetical protein
LDPGINPEAAMDYATTAIAIGAGATVVMDGWIAARKRLFGIPAADYAMVGRWVAHLARGRFRHERIAASPAVKGELALGWTVHYLTGIAFAGALLALFGLDWSRNPSIGPAIALGVGTVLAPFLIVQPGMGAGLAARRTPNPRAARMQSLVTHAVFGLGLYVAAVLLEWTSRT